MFYIYLFLFYIFYSLNRNLTIVSLVHSRKKKESNFYCFQNKIKTETYFDKLYNFQSNYN